MFPKKRITDQHKDFVEPLQKLEEVIAKLQNPETEIQIVVDFNMPSGDWDKGKHKEGALLDQRMLITNMQELCEKLLLQQIIIPTHRKGNTLDLVFANKPDRMHSQWQEIQHYQTTIQSYLTLIRQKNYGVRTEKNTTSYGHP